jgi:hypothetical protein
LKGISEIFTASIIRAVIASKTLVNFYKTSPRNISEVRHLHTPRRETLNSHNFQDAAIKVFENNDSLF